MSSVILGKELVVVDTITTEDGFEIFKVLHAGYESSPKECRWTHPCYALDNAYFYDRDAVLEWIEDNDEILVVENYAV